MEHYPVITLTTDFGYKDPFVGIIKGVILSINPHTKIVDLTHSISPQNITEAAFAIEMSFRSFPPHTIHIVVVDPGVGSNRRPILIQSDKYFFIGPDNGVFSRIYTLTERLTVIDIQAEHYFLPSVSSTFHSRDIFAPVAAWLSRGISIQHLGIPVQDYVTIPIPVPTKPSHNSLEGEVVYIDRFGNAITNIHSQDIKDLHKTDTGGKIQIIVKEMKASFMKYYSQAEDMNLCSLINSFEYLELFVNKGNASRDFDIAIGDKVRVVLTESF